MKIFIYGVPGVGKTTYSISMKKQNNFVLVEGDTLRDLAQKENTKEESPFVYVGTSEAFRKFGDLTEKNAIRGLKAVRSSMARYVNEEIEKHQGELLLECAFLDPEQVITKGRVILLVKNDEGEHRKQFFAHREDNLANVEQFAAARIIQNYLIEEAKRLGVGILTLDTINLLY